MKRGRVASRLAKPRGRFIKEGKIVPVEITLALRTRTPGLVFLLLLIVERRTTRVSLSIHIYLYIYTHVHIYQRVGSLSFCVELFAVKDAMETSGKLDFLIDGFPRNLDNYDGGIPVRPM